MKLLKTVLALLLVVIITGCGQPIEGIESEDIESSSSGEILTDLTAVATGRWEPFDGIVDKKSDLNDLVETAMGTSFLGLHRGHTPVEAVLEAYLGISHLEMHFLMEVEKLNLAGICQRLGFDPENLIETLTASFVPYIEEGVENGVVTRGEVELWVDRVRTKFSERVYWEG